MSAIWTQLANEPSPKIVQCLLLCKRGRTWFGIDLKCVRTGSKYIVESIWRPSCSSRPLPQSWESQLSPHTYFGRWSIPSKLDLVLSCSGLNAPGRLRVTCRDLRDGGRVITSFDIRRWRDKMTRIYRRGWKPQIGYKVTLMWNVEEKNRTLSCFVCRWQGDTVGWV